MTLDLINHLNGLRKVNQACTSDLVTRECSVDVKNQYVSFVNCGVSGLKIKLLRGDYIEGFTGFANCVFNYYLKNFTNVW